MKLFGYCLEDDQRLLVYEFMPKGSLDNHLFRSELFMSFCSIYLNISVDIVIKNLNHLGTGASYVQPLSWNHRMKIALGAAKGIAFGILHQKVCNFALSSNIALPFGM